MKKDFDTGIIKLQVIYWRRSCLKRLIPVAIILVLLVLTNKMTKNGYTAACHCLCVCFLICGKQEPPLIQ